MNMKPLRFFIIVTAVLFAAALAHDAALFYLNQDRGFMLSDIGFIWTHYAPESFAASAQWVVKNAGEDTWAALNVILKQKAAFVALGLSAIFFALSLIVGLSGQKRSRETPLHASRRGTLDRIKGNRKNAPYKYNRK